jgi:tRNA(Ile)-lysidine synthase
MNVIPELKKIKNDIHIPFNNFTDRIAEVHDLIAFNVQNFCNSDSYRVNDNNIEINKSDFYNLPFLVQLKIISNQCIDTKNSFSKTDVREIKDLLRKNLTGSSKTVNDKTILIDRNSLIIYKNMKNDIFINVEAGKEFKGKDFTFSWDFNKAPKTFNNDNEIEFIDASKITDNLVIRSVRDNDSFLPLGMSGNKKVAKFLKDKNLSFLKRKESLVVCNQDEIIWVAGYQLSEKYKIQKNSVKIAKLNFSRN